VAQLSPGFVAQAPIHQSVLLDQLGALLALTGAELSGAREGATRIEHSLHAGVHDLIKQRCAETSLQAADIAISLGISSELYIGAWPELEKPLAKC
jgi:hypothetical protein